MGARDYIHTVLLPPKYLSSNLPMLGTHTHTLHSLTVNVYFEDFMKHAQLIAEVIDSNGLPEEEQLNIQYRPRNGTLAGRRKEEGKEGRGRRGSGGEGRRGSEGGNERRE